MRCKCGKEIWGEGWNPKTGQRFYSHVEGGEEQHEDGTWVEPAAPTAPVQTDLERIQASYTSGGQSYEPTAPVGQPEPKPRRFSSLAKKANAPVSQFEKEFLEPAAPAANALPELSVTYDDCTSTDAVAAEQYAVTYVCQVGVSKAAMIDAVSTLRGQLMAYERQLAAAQREIAELLRILKAIFPVKVTMTSDDRINWEVNVRYAGTTGEEIENSIAHAELLGGKK